MNIENIYIEKLLGKFEENSKTFLEVCNCDNFIVIKGQTTSDKLVNVNLFNEEIMNFKDSFNFPRVIDIIEYSDKVELKKNFEFTFFNTENLLLETDTNNQIKTSKFPWGYSWEQGKLLYFYFKHITYNIPTTYPFSWIKYKVSVDDNNKVDFSIEDSHLNNHNNILKSAIMDSFDFNLNYFLQTAKKMDLDKMILNPMEDDILLKKRVPDFVIF